MLPMSAHRVWPVYYSPCPPVVGWRGPHEYSRSIEMGITLNVHSDNKHCGFEFVSRTERFIQLYHLHANYRFLRMLSFTGMLARAQEPLEKNEPKLMMPHCSFILFAICGRIRFTRFLGWSCLMARIIFSHLTRWVAKFLKVFAMDFGVSATWRQRRFSLTLFNTCGLLGMLVLAVDTLPKASDICFWPCAKKQAQSSFHRYYCSRGWASTCIATSAPFCNNAHGHP